MQRAATQRLSAWVRLAISLAAIGLLSACIGGDGVGSLDSSPAWLQDDNAVLAPVLPDLDDA